MTEEKIIKKKEEIKEEKKPEVSKKEDKKPVVKRAKKTKVVVRAYNVPISTKDSAAIGRFIRNKGIGQAIEELEEVKKLRKAVPMKGEIPHRKGKIMSGRFPKKAADSFLRLLRSLSANSNYHNLENPIIYSSVANIGERPFGRFGSVRKKRTHITITAISKQPTKKGNK